MRGKYVFIAAPIRGTGNPAEVARNVKQAMDTATELILAGHYPYCPHLCHFLNKNRPLPRAMWLTLSTAWLDRSDVVIRLPGLSEGADDEVTHALQHGMMIFYSVHTFLETFQKGKVYRFRPVEVPTSDQRTPMWTKGDEFPGFLYGYPILWRDDMESLSSPIWELRQRAPQDPVTEFSTFADYEAQKARITFKRTMSGSVEDQLGYEWTGKPDDPEMRERLAVPEVVNTAATPTVCSTCGVVNCNLMGRRKEGAECFAWIERSATVAWEISCEQWKRSNDEYPRTATLSASDAAGIELIRQQRILKAEAVRLQGALKVEQDMCVVSSTSMKELRKELGVLTGELVLEKKLHEAETMLRKEFNKCATDLTTENIKLKREMEDVRVEVGHVTEMTASSLEMFKANLELQEEIKLLRAEYDLAVHSRGQWRESYEVELKEKNRLKDEVTEARSAMVSAIEDRKKVTFVYKDSSEVTDLKYALKAAREDRDKFVAERDKLSESISCGNTIELERITADVERVARLTAELGTCRESWDAANRQRDRAVRERDEMERQRDLFVTARDAAMNLVNKEVAAREAAQKDLGHQVAIVLTVDIERRKALRAWEAAKMARDSAVTQRDGARKALESATNVVAQQGRKLIVCKADMDTAWRARDRAFKGSCRWKCPFRKESL